MVQGFEATLGLPGSRPQIPTPVYTQASFERGSFVYGGL